MSLYDEEERLRKGDEYNNRLAYSLRSNDMLDAEIDTFMNPLEYAEDREIKYHKPRGYYSGEPGDRYNQEEVNGKS